MSGCIGHLADPPILAMHRERSNTFQLGERAEVRAEGSQATCLRIYGCIVHVFGVYRHKETVTVAGLQLLKDAYLLWVRGNRKQPVGSLLLPADLVRRWERQIQTPYEALSDAEKESDREQVRRYLSLLKEGRSNQ